MNRVTSECFFFSNRILKVSNNLTSLTLFKIPPGCFFVDCFEVLNLWICIPRLILIAPNEARIDFWAPISCPQQKFKSRNHRFYCWDVFLVHNKTNKNRDVHIFFLKLTTWNDEIFHGFLLFHEAKRLQDGWQVISIGEGARFCLSCEDEFVEKWLSCAFRHCLVRSNRQSLWDSRKFQLIFFLLKKSSNKAVLFVKEKVYRCRYSFSFVMINEGLW